MMISPCRPRRAFAALLAITTLLAVVAPSACPAAGADSAQLRTAFRSAGEY